MIINHNIAALNTHRQLSSASANQSKSMEKLSSGMRINKAGDDAAGLAISEKMRGQIRGLDMASKNSQDGISMIATAEGALNETHDILQRMRELSVQASSDTNNDKDRAELQKELDQLIAETDRIANTTEFNTKKLLNGDLSGEKAAQVAVAEGTAVMTDAASTKVSKVTGAFTDTTVGTHEMTISVGTQSSEETALKFASNQKLTDLGVTDTTDMTIKVGGAAAVSITGLTTESTVQDLVNAINTQVTGATATLSDEGKLMINTNATADALVIADATGGDMYSKMFAGSTKVVGSATNLTVADKFTAEDGTVSTKTYRLATGNTASAVVGNGVTLVHDGTNNLAAGTVKIDSLAARNAVAAKTDSSATYQIGANEGQTVKVDIEKMDAEALALKDTTGATDKNISISSAKDAAKSITIINNAIESVSSERSKLGAFQNRLEHTINNLGTSSENLTAAESRIRDVDMAKEMMNQTKNSILSQAAQAMLAQSNQMPQGVLQLLR
ncbi:flagellin [Bacillus sp. ISL-57]|uniref:flagellin N-terminal helical domain-containing protein n=1 Tax=Bacillus sp. ISL-57 TaxID=2819135 RepID=UPI001BE724EA|nr:flagellin [Bacillus sp. ISL-57]MBT2717582.1 flagellin [Bacillus sp. ISL-57]